MKEARTEQKTPGSYFSEKETRLLIELSGKCACCMNIMIKIWIPSTSVSAGQEGYPVCNLSTEEAETGGPQSNQLASQADSVSSGFKQETLPQYIDSKVEGNPSHPRVLASELPEVSRLVVFLAGVWLLPVVGRLPLM